MPQNAEAVADQHDYLTCRNKDCAQCSTVQRQECITAACDGLTASVRDRLDNGGTHHTVRARALDLIRVMVADLETE